VRFRIDDVIAEGERVTVRWDWTGTHDDSFYQLAPTHIAIYELTDGKVVRNWLQVDWLGVQQQNRRSAGTSGC
jgi:predicted ester cyclase